jgi:hypothetical protein
MRIRSMKHTFVFDVLALGGREMFETESDLGGGICLKQILESYHMNVFWDVRQDQDALFNHYDVELQCCIDA